MPIHHYTLVRSKRKTLAIHISKDAVVEVRAPLHLPAQHIDRFVASKAAWIEDKLAKRRDIKREKAAFKLDYGDSLRLRGKRYPLVHRDGRKAGFDGECFYLPSGMPADVIKANVVQIYKLIAKSVIAEKIEAFQAVLSVKPAGFHITNARTRWGSCSAKKSLNFSWRLMMADDEVIDYIVVHELAHIRELNHSSRFWNIVENVMPDYKTRTQKLKQLQAALATQDWD